MFKIVSVDNTDDQIELEVEHDRSSGYIENNALARIKVFSYPVDPEDFLKKCGHIVECPDDVVYSWNQDVTIKSDNTLRLEAKKDSAKPVIILRDSDESILGNSSSASLQCSNNVSVFAEKQIDIINNTGNLVVSSLNGPIGIVEAKKNLILVSDDEDVTLYAPSGAEVVNRDIDETSEDKQITNKEYVDAQDDKLHQEIIELEEEIDAIAPSVERGVWTYDTTANNTIVQPKEGHYYLQKALNGGKDFTQEYSEVDFIILHNKDKNGVDHQWSDVEEGKLIQLYDAPDADYILGKIAVGGIDKVIYPNAIRLQIDRISSLGSPTNNAPYDTRVNIFDAPSGGGDASGFVLKTGDEMTGNLEMRNSEFISNDYDPNNNTAHLEFSTKSSSTQTDRTVRWWQPGYVYVTITDGTVVR